MTTETEMLVNSIRNTVLKEPLPSWPGGWKGEAEAAVIDAVGALPNVVAVDPTGRFAYVANLDGDSVTTFAIGTVCGAV